MGYVGGSYSQNFSFLIYKLVLIKSYAGSQWCEVTKYFYLSRLLEQSEVTKYFYLSRLLEQSEVTKYFYLSRLRETKQTKNCMENRKSKILFIH